MQQIILELHTEQILLKQYCFSDIFTFVYLEQCFQIGPSSVEHYAKVKNWSNMISKGFFLDLLTFLTQINGRPKEFPESIFLCTTIPLQG